MVQVYKIDTVVRSAAMKSKYKYIKELLIGTVVRSE